MIAMALRGGAKSKTGKARFGKCRLTITPPEFSKVRKRRIFRRKKLAGEDLLDPPMQMKDNAPCNNQPKKPKERKTKKGTFHQENCLPKSASKRTKSKRIPQVPPKEQEATKSPTPV
jgi:hypothetical protein